MTIQDSSKDTQNPKETDSNGIDESLFLVISFIMQIATISVVVLLIVVFRKLNTKNRELLEKGIKKPNGKNKLSEKREK